MQKENCKMQSAKFSLEKGDKEMCRSTTRQKSLLLLGLFLAVELGAARVSWAIEVGDKAPDFTLPSTTGKKINLSQFRGKNLVLLEFYVADFGAT
jgi:hypothetical protein